MSSIALTDLYKWCSVQSDDFTYHPDLKIPFRMVEDSTAMGELIAREFADAISNANAQGKPFRAIVPCGPKCWYAPFTRIINEENISLRNLFVFHMDECLDWQGRLLPSSHPYNFRSFMEEHFYGGLAEHL